jgi:integration host factor subunit beta
MTDTNSTINKTDIIERMALKNPHLSEDLVESSVSIILDHMIQSLSNKDRIEVRGFGSFHISEKEARIGRNPKTGEKVDVSGRSIPRFKAGRALRLSVDASVNS